MADPVPGKVPGNKIAGGMAGMATAARCFISAAAVDRGQCSVMTGSIAATTSCRSNIQDRGRRPGQCIVGGRGIRQSQVVRT